MFRHGSLRDDRRRRSLLEDANAAGETGATAKARRTSKPAESYTALARREHHSRWSDLVPRRSLSLAAIGVAGLLAIAALIAGNYFASRSPLWSSGNLSSLDLSRAGSLAGWFAALAMFVTAVLSIFIYTVRRYRLDDYRGRYRVWLAGAAMWLVMSIDVVADLRSAVRAFGVALSGRVGPGEGIAWWLAPWGLAVLWFGLRMVLDVRACRSAVAALVLGCGGLVAGFVIPQTSWQVVGVEMIAIYSGCSLVGYWLLFFAHLAFARHILLDAHGELPFREPKTKRKKAEPVSDDKAKHSAKTSAAAKSRDDLTSRIDPPHGSSYRPATSGIDLQRPQTQASGQSKSQMSSPKAAANPGFANAKPANSNARMTAQYGDDGDDEGSDYRKLSRAERKKLRKQQRASRHGDDD